MKRYFCNFFTAFISLMYFISSLPRIIFAIYSNDMLLILQELTFVFPYCIGNFIIATILIYSSFKTPLKSDDTFKNFIISFLGTNFLLISSYFVNFRNPNANQNIIYIFSIMEVAVQIFYIIALLNLGLSLTVLPEARKLKTKGIYSISRHPLYVSYMIINILNIFINQSLVYIPFAIVGCLLHYIRAKNEEKILIEVFPEYNEYKKEVMFIGRRSWLKFNKKTME